jgi:hypothetical protein
MKLAIIGATGLTGMEAVKLALAANHTVTALVRCVWVYIMELDHSLFGINNIHTCILYKLALAANHSLKAFFRCVCVRSI